MDVLSNAQVIISIVLSIASVGGAYRLFSWRLADLEKRITSNEANDAIRQADINKLQLEIVGKYVSTDVMSAFRLEIREDFAKMQAAILMAIADRPAKRTRP